MPHAPQPNLEPDELIDVTGSLGAFFVVSRQNRLFALREIGLSPNLRRLVPKIHLADFTTLYPIVTGIKTYKVVLVLHTGARPRAYFIMHVGAGAKKRKIKIFEETSDVIAGILEGNMLPVLTMADIERGIITSKVRKTPIAIPIRLLQLHPHVPKSWMNALGELFLANAVAHGSRDEQLVRVERALQSFDDAITQTVVVQHLMKCTWYDMRQGCLGRLRLLESGVDVLPFDPSKHMEASLLNALSRGMDGRPHTSKDIGYVHPLPKRGRAWVTPTLQIDDDALRETYCLAEHYSLHQGFATLSESVLPVLVLTGQDARREPTPVRLLRFDQYAAPMVQESVRSFLREDLVWGR